MHLLQQAHDAMRTQCEIEYVTNASYFPVLFSYSCSRVTSSNENIGEVGSDARSVGIGCCDSNGISVGSGSSAAHQVVWLCTALLAEVCLSTGSDGKEVDEHTSLHVPSAQLLNLCADAGRTSCCLTVPCHTQAYRAGARTDATSCENVSDSACLSSPYLQSSYFHSIASSIHLLSLSKNTIKDLAKQLTASPASCPQLISDNLILAALTSSYSCREIDFETYLVNMLMRWNTILQSDSTSANGASPSVVFAGGGHRWMLSTSLFSSDAPENSVGCACGHIFCRFTLLPLRNGPTSPTSFASEDSNENSDDDNSDSGSSDDSDFDSASDSSDSGSCSVLSQVELLHMLQELFVDILSIRIQSYESTIGTENCHCDDFDMVICIWLSISHVCVIFDPPHSIASSGSNGPLSTSATSEKIIRQFFCNALAMQRRFIQVQENTLAFLYSAYSVDVMGAALLRMLFVFSHDQIQRICVQAVDKRREGVDQFIISQRICNLLSLSTSVLVTIQYSQQLQGQGHTAFAEFLSSPHPLSNIFQVTLHSVLKELKIRKLLSLTHIEHLLCFVQKGRTTGQRPTNKRNKGKVAGPVEEILSEFFVLFPIQHPVLLQNCFSDLLTSDILDLCFEMLDNEVSDNNSRFYQAANTPSIERLCLKFSQYLNPRDMIGSLQSMCPDTLFKLAMVYFIAENFEGLLILQRILLDMKHPTAMYNFARVFSVCFESDSLLYQAEVMSAMLDGHKAFQSPDGSGTIMADRGKESAKRRRVMPGLDAWMTFQPEEISLLEHFSLDVLVTLSESLCSPPNPEQAQNITVDLTSLSKKGFVPASLTALAETQSHLVNLNMSHNHLVTFPLVVLDITTLLQLDLSWNMLSSMPSGIDALSHLQVLNISHNQFIYFPSAVLKLKASLLELYLQDNKLEEIRNDFLKLSQLEVLDVSNNRLKNVPSRLNSHMKLKFFRFSGNPIFDTFAASQPKAHSSHGPPGIFKFSSTSSIRLHTNKNKVKNRNKRRNLNKIKHKH